MSLTFPEKSAIRIEALKAKTEADNYSDVIKNALRLYEALIDEAEKGTTFLIKKIDGMVEPYEIFLSVRDAQKALPS